MARALRPSHRRGRGTIGTRLFLLAVGAALPLAIGLVTVVLVARHIAREDADARATTTARATAESFAGYLSRIAAQLARGALRDDVRAYDPSACEGFGQSFLDALPQAVSFVVVDPAGRVACSSQAGPAPVGDPAAIAAVRRGAVRAFGGPSTVGAGAPYATLVTAVPGPGARSGALVLGLGLDRLGTQLGATPPGENGSLGVLTRDLGLVARLPVLPAGSLGQRFPEYRAVVERRGVQEAKGIDGTRRLFAAAPVAGTDWIAYAAIARDEAYRIPDRILGLGLVFLIGGFAVASGLAVVLAGSLRRTTRTVALAAARLGAAERGVRVPERGPAELVEVAGGLNTIAAAWEASEDDLLRLRAIDAAILSAGSTEAAATTVVTWLREATGADRAAAMLVDDARGEVVVVAADGAWNDLWPAGARIPMADIAGLVARWRSGDAAYLTDLQAAGEGWASQPTPPVRSALQIPLIVEGRLVGVVSATSRRVDGIPREMHERAREIAGHLAGTFDRSLVLEARDRLTGRLRAILEIDRAILASDSVEEAARIAVDAVRARADFARASVVRYDVPARSGRILAAAGATPPGTEAGSTFAVAPGIDLDAMGRGEIATLASTDVPGNPFYQALRGVGISSLVLFPLRDQGELIGTLHVAAPADGALGGDVLADIAEISEQVAVGMRQMLLLQREREARVAIEEALAELAAVQELADTDLARLAPAALFEAILPRIRALMTADEATLLLTDADADVGAGEETRLRVVASDGLEDAVAEVTTIEIGQGVVGRVGAERRVMSFDEAALRQAVSPILRDRVRALVAAPIVAGDELLGVLHVGRFHPEPFGDADVRLLSVGVSRIAAAVERDRREARLERAVAARTAELTTAIGELDAFAYSVSHDLRAPLRAMRGFARALLEDYGDVLDEQGRDFARRIARAGTRMDALIDDLLEYARLARAELPGDRVDLDQVVTRALADLRGRGDVLRAHIEVAEGLGVVRAHPATLAMAVSNLLDNAFKYVEPGAVPRVRVRSERRGHTMRLWVEDEGIGIAPEHHERIFGVFERLHGQEAYEGTGVGLASIRKGVERMGGAVGVVSAVGAGSRFWIELPAWEER